MLQTRGRTQGVCVQVGQYKEQVRYKMPVQVGAGREVGRVGQVCVCSGFGREGG